MTPSDQNSMNLLLIWSDNINIDATDTSFNRISICKDIETGIEFVQENHISCVVCQHRPPNCDGIRHLQRVREKYPTLPIILFTEDGSEELATASFRNGATDYLSTTASDNYPFPFDDIVLRRIENVIVEHSVTNSKPLVEKISDAVVVIDKSGVMKYLNPSVEKILGYSVDELIGENSLNYIHPDDTKRVAAEFAEVSTKPNYTSIIEFRVQSAKGEWVDIETRTSNHVSADNVDGLVVVGRDITDRKQHEWRLNTLHETVRCLIEAESESTVAEITTDAARKILGLEVNTVFLLDEEGSRLEPATDTPEGNELFDEYPSFNRGEGLVWNVFESNEPLVFDDVTTHPDVYNPDTPIRSELLLPLGEHGVFVAGSTTSGEFTSELISLVKILSSAVETALSSVNQKQELKYQKDRLTAQNKRLETFSSMVAHDIRNPLTIASGYLDLVGDQVSTGEKEITEAAHALQRIERIIDDLLWLAQEGCEIGARTNVHLEKIAREAWSFVETKDAVLEIQCDRPISADSDRLIQPFENLFRNSVEHGGSDVTVRVGTIADGFFIEDTGTGIPADERDKVFMENYSTEADGTGFGLTIVETIATAHGWNIDISKSSESGARFKITDTDLLAADGSRSGF